MSTIFQRITALSPERRELLLRRWKTREQHDALPDQTVTPLARVTEEEPRTAFAGISPLVTIQPAEQACGLQKKRPFFWIHAAMGKVYCYFELTRHLRRNRTIYGIQAPGLGNEQTCPTGDEGLFSSIEDMAASYVEAILDVQPFDPPYFLGGYSFGGLVAFEMARQLQALGLPVALLALLDSHPTEQAVSASAGTTSNPITLPETDNDYTKTMMRRVEVIARSWRTKIAVSHDELCHLQPNEQLTYLFGRLREVKVVPDEMNLTQFRRYMLVTEMHDNCAQKYQPKPYAGRITLFRSNETKEGDPSVWAPLSSEPLEVFAVSGNHISMLTQPYVQSLAAQLQQCLDKVDGEVSIPDGS